MQSNTEKLLYNIGQYLKDGVSIKGSTLLGAAPIKTEITDTVSIDGTIEVEEPSS